MSEQELNNQIETGDFTDELSDEALDRFGQGAWASANDFCMRNETH